MVLPMPAEVISTVNQHAAACKKYEVITFTDKDGNIINNDNDPDSVEDEESANPEITGVDITGVDITGVPTEQQDENCEQNMDDYDYTNSESIDGNTDDNDNNTETENNETSNTPYDKEDNNITAEKESPEDRHITINDINTIEQMNTVQINIDPETGNEVITDDRNATSERTNNNRYNLRPRPTKRNPK